MSGSVEIVLWLHEYELRALEKQLASNGTDVEKRMQEMLADLYSECVPFEERQAIQERINAEHAEAVADQMANTTWAAYHITGHGEDLYFKTSKADTLLAAAKRLRTYLTAEDNPQPVSFAAVLKDRTEITRAEYDQLLDQRLQNTGKVSGVFEMDFDRDTFSAANAMDGWHTYRIHDVSVAAYAALSPTEQGKSASATGALAPDRRQSAERGCAARQDLRHPDRRSEHTSAGRSPACSPFCDMQDRCTK